MSARLRDPVEQQRTAFDHIQQGGSLGEKTPTVTDLLGLPSNITIGNTEIRPTIDPEAAVPEHIFCFDAVDVLGEGVGHVPQQPAQALLRLLPLLLQAHRLLVHIASACISTI